MILGATASRRKLPWLGSPWLWVSLLLIALAGGWLVPRWLQGPEVGTVAVRRGNLLVRIIATGRVKAPSKSLVGSTIVGRATAVHVDVGDRVRAGDVLVQLDDTETKAAVAQAEASLKQATARLDVTARVVARVAADGLREKRAILQQAERTEERARLLAANGSITQEQLDEARRALDVARSQLASAETQASSSAPGGSDFAVQASAVAQARAALAVARARDEQTTLRAPTDAIVLQRALEAGDVVQPGKELLQLARLGPLELTLFADEKDLASLHVGQSARASADAFARESFGAEVTRIAPAVDAERGTIEVTLKIPNAPTYLRPDMTVSVNIDVEQRADVLLLPTSCIADLSSPHPTVLLAMQGRVQRRELRLGAKTDGLVEVLDGLELGTPVLVDLTLQAGQRVRTRKSS